MPRFHVIHAQQDQEMPANSDFRLADTGQRHEGEQQSSPDDLISQVPDWVTKYATPTDF